jgi:ATP adenylyltransferase
VANGWRTGGVVVDPLWAPWRLNYVANPRPKPAADACFICDAIAATDDRGNYLVGRTEHAVVMLNKFPYNNGHLLVAPRQHLASPGELPDAVALELQQQIARFLAILGAIMSPDGFNIGLNLGRAAGAGLPGHLHWHIVPRWAGDTNFMPVLADTHVIVQSLDALYDRLTAALGPTGVNAS